MTKGGSVFKSGILRPYLKVVLNKATHCPFIVIFQCDFIGRALLSKIMTEKELCICYPHTQYYYRLNYKISNFVKPNISQVLSHIDTSYIAGLWNKIDKIIAEYMRMNNMANRNIIQPPGK